MERNLDQFKQEPSNELVLMSEAEALATSQGLDFRIFTMGESEVMQLLNAPAGQTSGAAEDTVKAFAKTLIDILTDNHTKMDWSESIEVFHDNVGSVLLEFKPDAITKKS